MASTMQLIPKHLDDPPRLLFWPMDEAVCFLFPFALLTIGRGLILTGLLLGIALTVGLRLAKQERGHARLHALLYWHLPSRAIGMRCYCPSYIREWIS